MYGKAKILLITVILATLVLGCTAPAQKTVVSGSNVTVDYTLKDASGSLIQTTNATIAKEYNEYDPSFSYTPFSFIAGSNSVIPGFDNAVLGMTVNQTKTVNITPDQGYGYYNASKVVTVPLQTVVGNNTNFSLYLNQTIVYNEQYVYVAALGANNTTAQVVPLTGQVYNITVNANNTATLDYNNPLAGKTLVFTITVLSIS